MARLGQLVTLADGRVMPSLGYGIYKVPPDQTCACVSSALDVGYRLIDTASFYANESGVGEALRSAEVAREDVFITTKLWNDDHGFDNALRAFDRSMDLLGLDTLDLYLIHWPIERRGLFVDTFRAMQRLRDEGRVKSLGVSNFTISALRRLAEEVGEYPQVNQIELHPWFAQIELREFHQAHDILTQAWAPLSRARSLDDPVLAKVAREAGCTPAQAILSWHRHRGIAVIPKSVSADRMRENLQSAFVGLTDAQIASIDSLDRGARTGPDPDLFP